MTEPGATEAALLRRAADLAARGLGTTSPNPVVGCVVLDAGGAVAGEGWHERAGGPHAEVAALAAAGPRARGGTVVVTLEPCAVQGRTPPCADALLAAGVARVVYAVPDPTGAGGGAALLRARGVAVEQVAEPAAVVVNEAWLHAVRHGRPFVIWKHAASLDGRVAAADGTSRWVTGPAARAEVHRLRAQVDAILVGSGTVLVDDPQLTARDAEGGLLGRQPLRVVADRRGRVPAGARVLDGSAPSLVSRAGDPDELLAELHARDVRSVLLEGGPGLAAAFVRAGRVDKVVAHVAPALLGDGPGVLGPIGVETMGDARRLRLEEVRRVGGDAVIVAYPVEEA